MMVRKLVTTLMLLGGLSASAQTLPALLLEDNDASQAALCCPSEAAAPEFASLNASAGFGRWLTSGVGSSIFSARADYRFKSGLEAGVSGKLVLDKPYEITNAKGMKTGEYEPEDYYIGIRVACTFADCIKAGLRARYICSYLGYGAVASSFGADLFAMYMKDSFRASVEACNLGGSLDYGGGAYPQPSLVRVSASWRPFGGLLLAADGDCLFSGAVMAGAGAEYSIADMVFLRAGYHYSESAKAIPSYATVGAGVKFNGLSLDAVCYLASQSLSGTAALRLGYNF